MKVLILSSLDDRHAKTVSERLSTMGAVVDFFKFDEFIERCTVAFELGTDSKRCQIDRDTGRLDLRAYDSIWYRRPGTVQARQFVEPWIGKMVESEARTALDGVLKSLSCVWMNLPANNFACQDKLWQLQVASKLGFSIPETLVTNDPALVLEFFEKCSGQVIYKLMGEQTNQVIPPNENPRGVSTLPLRKEDLPFIDQVAFAPHLFQKCIQKSCDLRITVVGQEIFGTRIDSQSGRGKIDWRHDYTVGMEPFELPADIAAMCFDLTKTLGLNYGAIDLVLTETGQYIFLEINCGGQYLWVEEITKQPISEAVCRLLVGAAEPLVKPV